MTIHIGIDLGTTNTVVAVVDTAKGNLPTIIPMLQPDKGIVGESNWSHLNSLPSSILIPFKETPDTSYALVGRYAKRAITEHSMGNNHYVRSCKRLIGTCWKKKIFGRYLPPHYFSSLILKTALSQARAHLGKDIEGGVVITIPAAFNSEQRRQTKVAAIHAGIKPENVILIDEPIAALFSQLNRNSGKLKDGERRIYMVIDSGGGTTDCSIVKAVREHTHLEFDVVASSRYNEVAGSDLDTLIAGLILSTMKDAETYLDGLDERGRSVLANMLVEEAERVKIQLSRKVREASRQELINNPPSERILLENLPRDSEGKIRRISAKIDYLTVVDLLSPYFKREAPRTGVGYLPTLFKPMDECRDQARSTLDDPSFDYLAIDGIFLAGGTALLPLFQEKMREVVPDCETVGDPMNAIAEGAALYNLYRSTGRNGEGKEVRISRRCFDGLYLKTEDGRMVEVIPPFRPIPSPKSSSSCQLVMPVDDHRLKFELFMGRSPNDPFLYMAGRRSAEFGKMVIKGSAISLWWSIDKDGCMTLGISASDCDTQISILDNMGINSQEIDNWPDLKVNPDQFRRRGT